MSRAACSATRAAPGRRQRGLISLAVPRAGLAHALLWAVLLGLAWPALAQQPRKKPEAPRPPEDSPQKLLALLGMEKSHLESFLDGVPLAAEEEEFLVRFLYCAARFPWNAYYRWRRPLSEAYPELFQNPARQRGNVFLVQGRLLQVTRHQVIPELARRIDIPHYYSCRIRLEPQGHEALVVVREIPAGWERQAPAGDRVEAEALLVKLQTTRREDPQPVFVARHLAWFPDTFLGRLGVDAAAMSRSRAQGPFVSQDRHPFYQLLRATSALSWPELKARVTPGEKIAERNPRFAKYRDHPSGLSAPAFWILTVVERPEPFRGTVLSVRGTARRAVRIEVTDPEIRTRYGIRHYWEVEIFVDPGPRIQLFGQTVAYYPVVACVSRLPAGFPEGENLHETVALEGVLFKVWSYYSALGMKQRPQQVLRQTDQDGDGRLSLAELARYFKRSPQDARLRERFDRADRNRSRFLEPEELQWLLGMQNAPLLVAPTLRWTREPTSGSGTAGLIGGVLVLAALLVLVGVLWRAHRGDDQLAQVVRRRLLAPEPELPEPDADSPSSIAPAEADADGEAEPPSQH